MQGLALVTFPAASTIFVSPTGFHLSSAQYGAMFVPQVALAIFASAVGPWLARQLGMRGLLLLGLCADLLAMALLSCFERAAARRFGRVRVAMLCDRRARLRLRRGRDDAEHLGQASGRGPGRRRRADAQRSARPRHGARAGVGGAVRRPGRLVGAAVADGELRGVLLSCSPIECLSRPASPSPPPACPGVLALRRRGAALRIVERCAAIGRRLLSTQRAAPAANASSR